MNNRNEYLSKKMEEINNRKKIIAATIFHL